MGHPHRVGIVGLGVISRAYLETLAKVDDVVVTAVADLDAARAEAVAASLPLARAMSVADLMAADQVDVVLNLTTPAAHAEIALGAIEHGKSTYGEKPLTSRLEDARAVIEAGRRAGVRVGCAPDTVLGTGTQTARALIETGRIGRPIAATAAMATPGHEAWHPNPDFYYAEGGGPLLDMGPYYVTSLVHLLGPVRSVVGMGSALRRERTIATGPRAGESFPVRVDSHVAGLLEHHSGAISTITMSFDSAATLAPPIEVHGELGSLVVPDPNHFHGSPSIRLVGEDAWTEVAPLAGFDGGTRGVGLLDLLRGDPAVPPRASGDLAFHVLEVMLGLLESTRSGVRTSIGSVVDLPSVVPLTTSLAQV